MFPIKFLLYFPLTVASAFTAVFTSPIGKREPTCYEVIIPVTITARNAVLSPNLTLNPLNIPAEIIGLTFSTVTGKFDIAGRYWEPEVDIASRRNTLQVLAHPATYDRNYVSGICFTQIHLRPSNP